MEKASSMRLKEVFDALDASPKGLTSEEAKARLKKYGFNTLVEKKNRHFTYKLLSHFKDLFGISARKTSKVSIFKTKLATSKWLILGIVAQLSILSFLIYVPLEQPFFGTTALGIWDWTFLASLALIVVFTEEIRKFFSRRWAKNF